MSFSVAISVYKNDDPEHFRMAMDSILNQSVSPDEVILVVDGPISGILSDFVEKYESEIKFLKVIRLAENKGHGIARKIGIEYCSNPLVAIMDSDDISVYNRFETQIHYFEENPNVDIVGGYISEFIDVIENIVGIRDVPLQDIDIKYYLKKRCPLNQVTVMFKKNSVLKSGSYQDWYCNEDYFLWCRMFLNGCIFGNISDVLVNVRVGKDMYNRRGGWKYFMSEAKLQKLMLNNKIVNHYEYIRNILIRFIVQVIIPGAVRGFVFRCLFRRSTNYEAA